MDIIVYILIIVAVSWVPTIYYFYQEDKDLPPEYKEDGLDHDYIRLLHQKLLDSYYDGCKGSTEAIRHAILLAELGKTPPKDDTQ